MKKLVFFVDDDKMILNLLEYTFSGRDGITVKTFPNGEECLDEIDENPDLVILDYNLSHGEDEVMNGLQVLKKIRETNNDAKVIMLSGQNDEELIAEILENKVVKFIEKDSYFIDTLIKTVEEEIVK